MKILKQLGIASLVLCACALFAIQDNEIGNYRRKVQSPKTPMAEKNKIIASLAKDRNKNARNLADELKGWMKEHTLTTQLTSTKTELAKTKAEVRKLRNQLAYKSPFEDREHLNAESLAAAFADRVTDQWYKMYELDSNNPNSFASSMKSFSDKLSAGGSSVNDQAHPTCATIDDPEKAVINANRLVMAELLGITAPPVSATFSQEAHDDLILSKVMNQLLRMLDGIAGNLAKAQIKYEAKANAGTATEIDGLIYDYQETYAIVLTNVILNHITDKIFPRAQELANAGNPSVLASVVASQNPAVAGWVLNGLTSNLRLEDQQAIVDYVTLKRQEAIDALNALAAAAGVQQAPQPNGQPTGAALPLIQDDTEKIQFINDYANAYINVMPGNIIDDIADNRLLPSDPRAVTAVNHLVDLLPAATNADPIVANKGKLEILLAAAQVLDALQADVDEDNANNPANAAANALALQVITNNIFETLGMAQLPMPITINDVTFDGLRGYLGHIELYNHPLPQ
jgi:hypothetical protein